MNKQALYFFGWFNNNLLNQPAMLLHDDLPNRNSLVSICTNPSEYDHNDQFVGEIISEWLDPVDLKFNEYHLIDYRVSKKMAQSLILKASAIFLHGGNPSSLNAFLEEYELSEVIKGSSAGVIIGASAGAMNMSAKFPYQDKSGSIKTYDGLGLCNFAFYPHFDSDSPFFKDVLMPLSQIIGLYAGCEDSTIRIKNGKLEFFGDVYFISNSKIQKMDEALYHS